MPSSDGQAEVPGSKLVIIGAGWHSRELRAYLQELPYAPQLLGFVDDLRPQGPWLDSEILGTFDALEELVGSHQGPTMRYITATGTNALRRTFVQRTEGLGSALLAPWTLIHPRASVGPNLQIGEGTCIAPGAVLTAHVRVGKHCIVNVNASVSHDTIVEDFTNINPGAIICGNVRIGPGAYIGAGATVIDKLSIGEGAIIGAGAVVVGDIPAYTTAVGVPARVIKTQSQEGVLAE